MSHVLSLSLRLRCKHFPLINKTLRAIMKHVRKPTSQIVFSRRNNYTDAYSDGLDMYVGMMCTVQKLLHVKYLLEQCQSFCLRGITSFSVKGQWYYQVSKACFRWRAPTKKQTYSWAKKRDNLWEMKREDGWQRQGVHLQQVWQMSQCSATDVFPIVFYSVTVKTICLSV